ncbi:discoidin domain-containing protein [Kribbella sp. CA-293567]|uniref:discoidin domain-containing protein n=1 Tax=Kribbella sp. CA-293567 TaxID=3002436 RepID=UPI0022DD989F|nr:discoidin domain-containing protein [Kribbella sp. CA-293567]WBQ03619.1 discoidin domain-containing protein [Kribbella sp. CA-293567]
MTERPVAVRRFALALSLSVALTVSTGIASKLLPSDADTKSGGPDRIAQPASAPARSPELPSEPPPAECPPAVAIRARSARASSAQAGHPGRHAIDGDLGTRWAGTGSRASLTLDLGTVQPLCGAVITWYRGQSRHNTFIVLVSTDNRSFRRAIAGRITAGGPQTYAFSEVATARYVRFGVTRAPNQPGSGVAEATLVTLSAPPTLPPPMPVPTGTPPPAPTPPPSSTPTTPRPPKPSSPGTPSAELKPASYWIAEYDRAAPGKIAEGNRLTSSADSYDHYNGAYYVDAAAAIFEASGRRADAERFLQLAENMVRSSSRRPDGFRGWISQRPDVKGQEVPLFESYAWRYVAHGLGVVRAGPLYSDPAIRGRYAALASFLDTNLFDKWTRRGTNAYVYRVNTHMAAHWAFIAMEVARQTPDPQRRAEALEIKGNIDHNLPNRGGQGIKDQLKLGVVDADSYFFNDTFGQQARPGSDVAHANGVISYVAAAAEDREGWTEAEMRHFGHLLTDVVLPKKAVYVDGSGAGKGTGWIADGFVKLGRFDSRVQQALENHSVKSQPQYLAQMAVNAKLLRAG